MIDEKFREQLNALGDDGFFRHYVLKGREPVRVDFFEWLNLATERGELTVQLWRTDVGGASVSTIFLGFDLNWPGTADRAPILFETMIFGGGEALDRSQWRYATYDEAEIGHAAVVQAAKNALH
jgi:hypothetical protein